jgi:hypothetical protein
MGQMSYSFEETLPNLCGLISTMEWAATWSPVRIYSQPLGARLRKRQA